MSKPSASLLEGSPDYRENVLQRMGTCDVDTGEITIPVGCIPISLYESLASWGAVTKITIDEKKWNEYHVAKKLGNGTGGNASLWYSKL